MITEFISNNSIYFQAFSTVFISILLESFPFIMLGVIISSIINTFVSEDSIRKIIPKNIFVGTTVGAFIGFLFPVCDCGVIPVARRLIKKGVPVHTGIAFMLAAPIINPVVLMATYYAFKNTIPEMIYYRTIFGLIIAITVGIVFGILTNKKDILKDEVNHKYDDGCSCGHHHDHHEHHIEDSCNHQIHTSKKSISKINNIINHSCEEFFDVGKYLIIGAAIAASVQTFVPRDIIEVVGQNPIISILVMMIFAYFLALCSTSDSFIAKTFVGQFTNSSILAFLLIGPMIDIKNTIMLFGNFKAKNVIKLISLIFLFCCVAGLIAEFFLKF